MSSLNVDEREDAAPVQLVVLPEHDISLTFLEGIVGGYNFDKEDDAGDLTLRFVSLEDLETEFNLWFARFQEECCGAGEASSSLGSSLGSVFSRNSVSRGVQKAIFSSVAEYVSEDVLGARNFREFKTKFTGGRRESVVATVICNNPRLVIHHIPVLYGALDMLKDPGTVFEPTTEVSFNRATDQDELCISQWTSASKFRSLCNANTERLIAWTIFVDKTRVVKRGSRRCHVIMARPLNHPQGRYGIVGFIPIVENAELQRAGIVESKAPFFRALLEQICLSVTLLYCGSFKKGVVFLGMLANGDFALARSVVACVSADGEEICNLTGRFIPSTLQHAPQLACWRHQIGRDKLNEVVRDPDKDHKFYLQGPKFKQFHGNLLREKNVLSWVAFRKKAAQYGLSGVRPALFDAYMFDCARDIIGDIQHVGAHGVGLNLLEFLPRALRDFYPDKDGEGRLNDHVFSEEGDSMTLGLQKGTVVVLHCQLPSYILPRPDFYYVTASVDGKTKKGFVRKSCISVVKAFDHSYRKALAEFDSGLSTMSHSYVYSYSRFDFQKLEEIDEDNSPLFGRATTVELVLLYTPLVLSSLLRGIDDAAWLVKTFDLFSRFYWNWRRPSFFLSDNAVMEGQRVELKQLIVKYWGRFSPTEFSTMKFEQLDHVWRDLFWQGPVTFTSTGAGDNAHILLAKVPFISGTNRTNVQSSLTEQLMSFGDVPEFVKRGALREPKLYTDSNTCLGAGEECYWGNLTARIMVDLGKTWSEDENIFNAPRKAMQELLERLAHITGRRYSSAEGCAMKCLVFKSMKLQNDTMTLCGSSSYHGARRHDFVVLRNGSFGRLICFIQLEVNKMHYALVEMVIQATEREVEECGASRLQNVEVLVETDEWHWIEIGEIVQNVCCVRHPVAESFHFVLGPKHRTSLQ